MEPFDHLEAYAKNHKLRLILMLGALTAFGPLTIDMYLPSFPSLTRDLQTTASLTQLSLTACLLGISFGQLVVGALSDVYGRKRPLLIALLTYVTASLLCAVAPSIGALIACRFIQGAAGAGGIVIARSCVRDLYSGSEMTKMFSLLILVMGAAPILAPMLGGQLLNFVSWRGIFIALSAIGMTMALVAGFGLRETLPARLRSTGGFGNTVRIFGGLLRQRVFMGFALVQGLITASMFAYISGSPFVLQGLFHLSPQTYSLVFGLNAAGFILASQVTGRLAGNIREMRLMAFGFALALAGGLGLLAAILAGAGIVFVCIALFVAISSIGIINPTCLSLAMQAQRKNAGSASALLGLFQFVLGGVVAPAVGLAGTGTALPMAGILLLCQAGALASFFFLVYMAKSGTNPPHHAESSANG